MREQNSGDMPGLATPARNAGNIFWEIFWRIGTDRPLAGAAEPWVGHSALFLDQDCLQFLDKVQQSVGGRLEPLPVEIAQALGYADPRDLRPGRIQSAWLCRSTMVSARWFAINSPECARWITSWRF